MRVKGSSGDAASHNAIRNGSIGLDFFRSVANDFFDELRITEDKRQSVLQRIARRTLKAHDVLVDVALREYVLAKETVISEGAAQVIVVHWIRQLCSDGRRASCLLVLKDWRCLHYRRSSRHRCQSRSWVRRAKR